MTHAQKTGNSISPRSLEQLTSWFETGLKNGRFDVRGGRHIVLNEYPRLMKLTRLQFSAGADHDSLVAFLLRLDPEIKTATNQSLEALEQELQKSKLECPRLCKVTIGIMPNKSIEQWFVYTPPLSLMRSQWASIKPKLREFA